MKASRRSQTRAGFVLFRTLVIALLSCCFVVRAGVAQSSPALSNAALQSLADEFWQWRARYQPFSQDDIPRIDHPDGPKRLVRSFHRTAEDGSARL